MGAEGGLQQEEAEVAEAPVVPQDIMAGVGVEAAMAVERFTPIPAAPVGQEGRGGGANAIVWTW